MKKTVALLVALVLLLTVSFSAVAEEETQIWPFNDTGIKLAVPEKWNQIQGLLYPLDIGEFYPDHKIACTTILYIPLSEEDRALIAQSQSDGEHTEEQSGRISEAFNKTSDLYSFFSVGNGKTFEDVRDVIFQNDSPDRYIVDELGQVEDYRFYLMTLKADSEEVANSLAQFPENCREEYIDLLKDVDTVKAAVTLQKPEKPGANTAGTTLSFELNDFSGKSVRSEDLFAGRKVTLVNLWASWCGPCAVEMPELEAIWQEYGAKGAGVIGICEDAYKEKALADAKEVAAEGRVTYPMLACTKDLEAAFLESMGDTVPTSFFVNGEGVIIGELIIGVDPDAYRAGLDKYLAE